MNSDGDLLEIRQTAAEPDARAALCLGTIHKCLPAPVYCRIARSVTIQHESLPLSGNRHLA
jgi:hypothetical protein